MKKGVFIVLEGIDGGGKSTQAALLGEYLQSRGIEVVLTREPTDSVWGRRIREIAKLGRSNTSLDEEVSWFVEDRKLHVESVVKPALARGAAVVSDRYYYSNMAYQGALGADVRNLRRLNEKENGFPRPDIVIMIDISPSAGVDRINSGRDGANAGYERTDFLEKVKAIYDSFDDGNIVRIQGAQSRDAVARCVKKHIDALLSERRES